VGNSKGARRNETWKACDRGRKKKRSKRGEKAGRMEKSAAPPCSRSGTAWGIPDKAEPENYANDLMPGQRRRSSSENSLNMKGERDSGLHEWKARKRSFSKGQRASPSSAGSPGAQEPPAQAAGVVPGKPGGKKRYQEESTSRLVRDTPRLAMKLQYTRGVRRGRAPADRNPAKKDRNRTGIEKGKMAALSLRLSAHQER